MHLDHTIFAEAFEFLTSVAQDGQTPKLTIPSPNMVHYRGGRAAVDERVYPDMEEFWSDLCAGLRRRSYARWASSGARISSSTTPRWPT